MKSIIYTLAVISSMTFILPNSFGAVNMNEKLQEIVKFKKGSLSIDENSSAFVKVSFKINEKGLVEILEMNYSDEIIKTQLVDKLSEIKVEEDHNVGEIYNYNFTFKKI
ncbi:MAG: hypothetical protein P1U41_11115 [Vicingaceae bacterium]|nr:hypothetical protein [Vicingaceae bacterium]